MNFTVAEDTIPVQYSVASGTLHYKTASGSYVDYAFTGSACNVPANTLTVNNTYTMYATCIMDDGTSADTATWTITTTDSTPSVTPIYPVYATVSGTFTFKWTYSSAAGFSQYAYDLQLSHDNSTWTDIASKTVTTETTLTYTISTAGKRWWRIRLLS